MTAAEFLRQLRELDIRVSLQNGRLRINAPTGRLTPELQSELAARKDELQAFLEENGESLEVVTGEFPASFAQRRLWFLDHLQPGNIAYNLGASHEINGPVDVAVMERALNAVVRRQSVLRCVFRRQEDELVQIFKPFEPLQLQVHDLTTLPAEQRETELGRLKKAEAQRPFDLAEGPLFRVALVRLTQDRHVLLFTLHHSICDGWSLGIFLEDLGAFYAAFHSGSKPVLPELGMSYGDYARRERDRLHDAAMERMLEYWKQRLSGAPQLLELPTDRPRPPQQTLNGDYVEFRLPRAVTDELRKLAGRERASLYMVLLAIFNVLLHRYSGQTDIVIGTPLANRDDPQLERLIGLFVSTLAIRTKVDTSVSIVELIRQVRETVLEAQEHQDLPFDKLVEVLRPERSLAWSPIFQVTFALQNTPLASRFSVTSAGAMFDLSVFCWEDEEGIRGTFEYNTDLFDAATIQRMARHFRVLSESVVRHVELPLSEHSLLTGEERALLLGAWTATCTEYPRDVRVEQLFREVARHNADAIALQSAAPEHDILPQTQFTYSQLDAVTDQLAKLLLSAGVKAGTTVGLCMERSIGAILGILGILKAGAAYLPIDTGSPRNRIREVLSQAGTTVVVCQKSLTRHVDREFRTLTIEELWSRAQRTVKGSVSYVGSATDRAYVMFTSGTTGKQKGVCVSHRSIVRLVRNTNYIQLGPEDVILQFAPLAFDAATFEIWGALLNGARLVVHPQLVPTAAELAKTLATQQITTLWLTAGFFHYMVEHEPAAVAAVKNVLAGGDVLSVPHVQRVLDLKRDGVVINGYGPTENTTFTCCHVMYPGTRLGATVPIGKPIANTRVYILEPNGQPAPIGVPGELFAAGDGVALGYLGASAADEARFSQDVYDGSRQARMYRTGDRARWRPDGTIEFLGRTDRQVKVRGFRIELEEVEDALRQCSRVQDAAVTVHRDAFGVNEIVAYLVPRPGRAIDQADTRRELAERVPEYMIPAHFVMLREFPLTPNGKLDRAALPKPRFSSTRTVEAPRTMLEAQIHAIWERLFGRSDLSVRDNFFELGGHSLLAVRMFAQVEQVLGRRVPVSMLFQAPTIEQLAARLEDEGFRTPWESLVPIQPNGSRPPLFLVPGMGGNVVGYMELARLLGPEQPFYGLQARGLDGREKPFDRIEPMAEHYIREIRKVQPHGPYHLGGACFGGVVAYEMAQQLCAAGESVAFLMLLETWPPTRRSMLGDLLLRGSQHLTFLTSAVHRNLAAVFSSPPREAVREFLRRSKAIGEMIARRDIYRGDSAAMYVDRVSTANRRAFSLYRPKPYDGTIFLVLASARPVNSRRDPRLTWADRVRAVDKVEIPALDSGFVLKSPHVELLAAAIDSRLRSLNPTLQKCEASSSEVGVSVAASV